MLHQFPLLMVNHQMLVFLKPVHLLLVYEVFVLVVADLCTYQLYNIVGVESVLVEVQCVLVGMEFVLVKVQFMLMEVQFVLVEVQFVLVEVQFVLVDVVLTT